MGFKPLAERIDKLPLVICGPILRDVNSASVSVWVALKEEREVTLKVFLEKDKGVLDEEFSSTPTKTIKVGDHLHMLCITAKNGNNFPLIPNELYYYDLFFEASGTTESLLSEHIIDFDIYYNYEDSMDPQDIETQISAPPKLPSFSLPPDDLNDLRIVHGSCRKPNGEGIDAMPTIDKMISSDWTRPSSRPHFLFLSGDQIYADDVSPIVLHMLMDASSTLLGSNVETFPKMSETVDKGNDKIEIKDDDKDKKYITLENGKPTWNGKLPEPHLRGRTIFHFGGLSEKFKNHLMTIGEYCAMYLFVWSDALWDKDKNSPEKKSLPEFETVFEEYLKAVPDPRPSDLEKTYKKDQKSLLKFGTTLSFVRRALANVPTYMIFDDHEVTDDWHMTQNWCNQVLTNILGKRIIQNGMIAFTLFQGWGNTPLQFEGVKPGRKILNILEKSWKNGYLDASEEDIAGPLGLPISRNKSSIFKSLNGNNILNAKANDEIISWNYHLKREKFEIIVLDGRTKRAYPKTDDPKASEFWHASLIHDQHIDKQIPPSGNNPSDICIIVSPTSIVSIPAIDFDEYTFLSEKIAKCMTKGDETLDVYDHWENQSKAFENLLHHIAIRGKKIDSKIVTKNLILTGDVHFAAASRLLYQNNRLVSETDKTPANAIFTQFVSSSFKKQTARTRLLHHNGYKFTTMTGLSFEKPTIYLILRLSIIGDVLIFLVDRFANLIDNDTVYLHEPKLPDAKEFFGWEGDNDFTNVTQLEIKSQNILGRIYESFAEANGHEPDYTTVSIKPIMLLSKDQASKVKDTILPNPRWRYKIDYVLAENEVRQALVTGEILDVGNPSSSDKNKALKEYLKASKNHSEFIQKHGSGKEIVGLNNVSEISFDWKEGQEKLAKQKTWWHLKKKDKENPEEPEQFFPLTKYNVSLEFKEEDLPGLTS